MQFSLSTKIILSMAGMVFLTALACCGVFLVTVTNQTRVFEKNLQYTSAQLPPPLPASEAVSKLTDILTNDKLTAEERLAQAEPIFARSTSPMVAGKVLQIAADSGWPVSDGPGEMIYFGTGSTAVGPTNVQAATGGDSLPEPPDYMLASPAMGPVRSKELTLFENPMYSSILIASVISVIFAVGLGFVLSRTVIRPLRILEKASERIADGNYTLQLKPEGKDDLGRLATSFNKMSRALRQTEQKRKDLLADLSHELRTPLSGIQGYTEALRFGLVQDERRRDTIYDHILSEVKYLGTMVNLMREWTNAEQMLDSLRLETFKVKPVLQNVLNRFGPAAAEKKVELILETSIPDPQIYADAESLNHIVSNLVDNALRYTPSGGSIRLNVRVLAKEKLVEFKVIDNGCGIPAEHLPFVFERFYRVDKSRHRATGGSGLGLAIVRDAVQAQGGDIKIESEVGVGVCVTFHLRQEATFSRLF